MVNQQRNALICGISGQDGAYLAKLLLDNGYRVFGTSRDAGINSFQNLVRLGIRERVEVVSMAVYDFRSVIQLLTRFKPDEIYNLSGESSVVLSFEQPVETFESINTGTVYLLEAVRFLNNNIRFYNAASSECFGDTGALSADETTHFGLVAPMLLPKPQRIGRLLTIGKLMGYLHAQAFCSTMNHLLGLNGSLLRRLLKRHVASQPGVLKS